MGRKYMKSEEQPLHTPGSLFHSLIWEWSLGVSAFHMCAEETDLDGL